MALISRLTLLFALLLKTVPFSVAQASETKNYLHTDCEGSPFYCNNSDFIPDFYSREVNEVRGKSGVLDEDGKVVIPFIYEDIEKDPYKPLFKAKRDDKNVWLNLTGNVVDETVALFPTKKKRRDYLGCGHGLFVFERDGLFGLKFETGRVLIDPNYYALTCFRNGFAWGAKQDIGVWCPIDSDGVEHVGPKCRKDVATLFPRGYVFQKMSGSDHFEMTANWNRDFRKYGLGKRAEPPGYHYQPTF